MLGSWRPVVPRSGSWRPVVLRSGSWRPVVPRSWSWRRLSLLAALAVGLLIISSYHSGRVQLRDEDVRSSTPADRQPGDPACSLRRAARQRPGVLRGRLNFSTPVFQWRGTFTEPAYQRLSRLAPPYGWLGVPADVVRSTLALLNSSSSRLLVERRSHDRCMRCAVVGNGGILRGSGRGEDIDDHDLVFRVNGAVTRGFESDVGTKTSFYGFTTNTLKGSLKRYRRHGFTQVPQGPETRYIFIPANLRDYVMMASAVRRHSVPTGVDAGDRPWRYFGNGSQENFRMLHPDFISYLTDSFLKSPLLTNSRTRQLYMPSTGALTLLAALHTCDQVSAYGFITRNYASFSTHYYDPTMTPLRFYSNHDLRMESRLWEELHRLNHLHLYTRKH